MSGKEIIILLLTFTFEVEMAINPIFLSNRKMPEFHYFLQIRAGSQKCSEQHLRATIRLFNLMCLMKRNQLKILLLITTLLRQVVLTLKCIPPTRGSQGPVLPHSTMSRTERWAPWAAAMVQPLGRLGSSTRPHPEKGTGTGRSHTSSAVVELCPRVCQPSMTKLSPSNPRPNISFLPF